MALVNTGPTHPSIHTLLFLSFCNQCSFGKPIHFPSEAWNDCINPLPRQLTTNQPSFLLQLQYTIRPTFIGRRNPILFLFYFIFVLCNRWPQTNFWIRADFGWDIFPSTEQSYWMLVTLLVTSSGVASCWVSNWMEGKWWMIVLFIKKLLCFFNMFM
jgi:hypothetical protein